MRRAVLAALVAAVAFGGVAGVASARAKAKRDALFALVIGYNQSDRKDQQRLRYADDDAVLSAQLMRQLGGDVALLSELDPATRKLYPALSVAPPTLAAVRSALKTLDRRMRAAKARGARAVLYLFYTGHGDVERGEGYVQLKSGRLYRSTLLRLLGGLGADAMHVIIDACKSYFVVFDRGRAKRRRTVGGFLTPDAPVPARAGFILSTSSAQNSHEWEAFQAGIFSHEVRSALRGAADHDGDGRVSYAELAAFVYTANRAIPNRRFRPSFFVRRPRARSLAGAPLIDLRRARGRRVVFGPRMSRHFFVETRLGVRLADLHPGRGRVTLLVPPRGRLFVREPRARREYIVGGQRSPVILASLRARKTRTRARGAEHEAFTRLFAAPFDGDAIRLFRRRSQRVDLYAPPPAGTFPRWVRPALGVLSLASIAIGATFTVVALAARAEADSQTSQRDLESLNHRIRVSNVVAATSYALGGAAGAGFLLWTFWPERRVPVRLLARVGPLYGSLGVTF